MCKTHGLRRRSARVRRERPGPPPLPPVPPSPSPVARRHGPELLQRRRPERRRRPQRPGTLIVAEEGPTAEAGSGAWTTTPRGRRRGLEALHGRGGPVSQARRPACHPGSPFPRRTPDSGPEPDRARVAARGGRPALSPAGKRVGVPE